MASSRQVAGMVGPTLVAVTVSELFNWRIWTTNIAPLVYVDGVLLFVAGLAILRAHNVWVLGWPAVVTLTGWIAILGGLYRMFWPTPGPSVGTAVALAVTGALALVGAFLTFKAYTGRDPD